MEAFVSVQEGGIWQPIDTAAHIHANGMFVVLEDISLLVGQSELLLAAGVPTDMRQTAAVTRQVATMSFVGSDVKLNHPGLIIEPNAP